MVNNCVPAGNGFGLSSVLMVHAPAFSARAWVAAAGSAAMNCSIVVLIVSAFLMFVRRRVADAIDQLCCAMMAAAYGNCFKRIASAYLQNNRGSDGNSQ